GADHRVLGKSALELALRALLRRGWRRRHAQYDALHLHAGGARPHRPRSCVPALDQEHQRRQVATRGDRVKLDRGDPQGARAQGANRASEGAAGIAGAEVMDGGSATANRAAAEAVAVLRDAFRRGSADGLRALVDGNAPRLIST